MTNEAKRKERIELMFNSIKTCTDSYLDCDKNKLFSVMMYDFGLSKRVVTEYLDCLINSGRVIDDNGKLWIKKYKSVAELEAEEVFSGVNVEKREGEEKV